MTTPLAVNLADAAALFGVSPRTWARMHAAGHCPEPLRLGERSIRWAVDDLQAWAAAGGPTRAEWERMRKQGARQAVNRG